MATESILGSDRSPTARLRVLVVVSGGVAEFLADEGVDVVVFDWDDYRSSAEMTVKPPRRFADLAAKCDIPVSSDLSFEAP
jgi:hypothetical protein